MKKIFSVSALIIGTTIGAGFASGREIITFFGACPSPWTALFVAVMTFLFCAVFLFVGNKVNASEIGEVNRKIARPFELVLNIFMIFNCVITMSAMLAGIDALLGNLFALSPLYSIVFALLSTLVVVSGISGLMRVNVIIVPALIVVMTLVCAFSVNEPVINGISTISVSNIVVYTALNGILSASVLTTVNGLSKKQILLSSALSALVIGALVLLLTLSLSSTFSLCDMPVVELAKRLGTYPFIFAIFAVLAGIFTTMITAHASITEWVNGFFHNRISSAFVSAIFCLVLSFLGFKKVIDVFYPIIGTIGIVYLLVCLIYLIRTSRKPFCAFTANRNKRVHKRRKQAQNNG